LFAPEDRKHRFYHKKPASARVQFHSAPASAARKGPGQKTNYLNEQLRTEHDAQKEADRILLMRFSPAGVVINAEMEILQFRGSTGAYLEPPVGKGHAQFVEDGARGLDAAATRRDSETKKDDLTIRKEDVAINYNGELS